MPDFIANDTLETITALTRDLDLATTELIQALKVLQSSSAGESTAVTPQYFVERVVAPDEQISRTRLLLPLCRTGVGVSDGGRLLSLSDLITETRSEFDTLARAQLEALIDGKPE
jgi:hypothetical protein